MCTQLATYAQGEFHYQAHFSPDSQAVFHLQRL